MEKEIKYIKGDATTPHAGGNKIIVHVCNDIGGWGRGFVMALSAKWKEPEMQYREWHKSGSNFRLGEVQFVQVEDDIWVANMIGQRDIRSDSEGYPPIRYEAVKQALEKVATFAMENSASVHMPRIGCGLAGGIWDKLELVIYETIVHSGIHVNVYDL